MMRLRVAPASRLALAVAGAVLLGGAGSDDFDISSQIGPNPVLPAPHQYLFPPMKLANIVGWQPGETPQAPAGMHVEALATGLQHPRSVYPLPNGDVLVVESVGPGIEPITRPKTIIMNFIESMVTSSGKAGQSGKSNRITLLRSSHHDGKMDVRTVFIDDLNSPFGVALVGNDLYVANTDARAISLSGRGRRRSPPPGRC